MLILILIPFTFSLSSDCQYRSITDCLELNMHNLKFRCSIKNNRCIEQRPEMSQPQHQGTLKFQYLSKKERLEVQKNAQKRRSKFIKNRFQDEYSEQDFGTSFSISNSYSGDLFDNFNGDGSYSYCIQI